MDADCEGLQTKLILILPLDCIACLAGDRIWHKKPFPLSYEHILSLSSILQSWNIIIDFLYMAFFFFFLFTLEACSISFLNFYSNAICWMPLLDIKWALLTSKHLCFNFHIISLVISSSYFISILSFQSSHYLYIELPELILYFLFLQLFSLLSLCHTFWESFSILFSNSTNICG